MSESEDSRQAVGGAEWKHDQDLSFKNVRTALEVARDGVERALVAEKERLSKLVGARDSLRR